jgi:pyruvate/2-oxoglutarate dehydrogenase complex dihydrolipoamide dehydrogenase (E3) component
MVENDRARVEGVTGGHAKIVTARNGRIVGAAIAGPGAGELIGMWQVAATRGLNVRDMAGVVLPYPTLNEVGKRAALTALAPAATSGWLRSLLGLLRKFG